MEIEKEGVGNMEGLGEGRGRKDRERGRRRRRRCEKERFSKYREWEGE